MRAQWLVRRIRCPGDTGAAAVEFALILVPLMILVMGIIGFGIVFTQKQSLSNAARDAARAGVVPYATPITCDSLVTKAKNDSETLGLNPSAVTVEVTRGTKGKVLPDPEALVTVCSSNNPQSTKPCLNATQTNTTTDDLTVTTSYVSTVDLFFASKSFTLIGKGTFRCEYTT